MTPVLDQCTASSTGYLGISFAQLCSINPGVTRLLNWECHFLIILLFMFFASEWSCIRSLNRQCLSRLLHHTGHTTQDTSHLLLAPRANPSRHTRKATCHVDRRHHRFMNPSQQDPASQPSLVCWLMVPGIMLILHIPGPQVQAYFVLCSLMSPK